MCEAIERAERGIVDADLGDGVIKQRVARPGQGRAGGYRTVIAYRSQTRAVFLFGFAKSDLENISQEDFNDLRNAARAYLKFSDAEIDDAIAERKLAEVNYDR